MSATDLSPARGLAELRTPEGNFLIQERRASPRDPSGSKAPQTPAAGNRMLGSTPAMAALGGLIILGVLIGSYTVKYDLAIGHPGGLRAFPAIGSTVLQLFLARAAFRLFDEAHHMPGFGAYIEQRALRYVPATIPGVLIGFAVSLTSGLPVFHSSVASLPANLTMIADFAGVPGIDPSHWRLKIELLYSLLIGMMWFSRVKAYIPMMLLFGLILSVLDPYGEPARQHTLTLFGLATADGYLACLAFGVVLYQLVQKSTSVAWQIVAAMSVVLVFLSNDAVHGFWTLASFGFLTMIVTGRCDFLGKFSWLVTLGNLAFPIYVVHYVAGFALIHRLECAGFSPAAASIAAGFVAILLGWIIHVLFERPALKHGPAMFAALRRLALTGPAVSGGDVVLHAK